MRRALAVAFLLLAVGRLISLADAPQLVSARSSSLPQPGLANGDSVGPCVSPDGRYVLFSSIANNLVPDAGNRLRTDVYLRDRTNQTTLLISTNISGTGGGNGHSERGVLSSDARFVVFESDASNLVAGVANGFTNLYVRDLQLNTTTLVNAATNGGFPNGPAWSWSTTPDGRFVAFISSASNLVAKDTNGISDVLVRDILFGTTILVSVGASGTETPTAPAMATPYITPDGRYVVFSSTALTQLAGGIGGAQVFIRDLVANTTSWGSAYLYDSSFGYGPPNVLPLISDDGRYFYWVNTSSGPINPPVVLFRDLQTTNIIPVKNRPVLPSTISDGYSALQISGDGRYFLYIDQTNGASIRMYDRVTSNHIMVSQNLLGAFPTNSYCHSAIPSTDMRYVLFMSSGTNMVTNATVLGSHLYRRDLQLGMNLLIDVDTNGAGSVDVSGAGFSMSPDARFIAFSAQDGSFVPGDTNRAFDVFLRDTLNGTTELISVPDPSVPIQSGAAFSSLSQTALSQDGHWLVFTSAAGDLVTNDFNGDLDVFARDLNTGSNFLVSVATNGAAGLGGPSFNPVISADGRFIAFVSAATNIVAGDTNIAADIFLRDMLLQTTVRLDVDTAGTVLGNGDASAPAMSQDGRYSVFLCRTNYQVVSYSVFWRDAVSNQTILLTNNSTTNIAPSISADGRYVAFGNNFSQLFVWDAQGGTNIYTNNFNAGGAAISPSGQKLLYSIPQNILHQTVVTDLATKSNLFSFLRTTPVRSPAQWSGDDRFFAFVWTTNGIPGDTNGTNDVYLCDTQTGTLTLVSMNAARTGSGNGVSDSPALNGDGRFVVFRSLATDIVVGATNVPNLFVFDRFTGSNALITLDQVNTGWNSWTAKPAVSSSGGVIAFQSYRSGFAPFDLNLVQDVFAAPQTPWPVTDADGDGIPDAWTLQYFGHPLGQVGDLSRAQDDADGDGLSNLQEFLTGTNPVDFNSALRLKITATVSNNTVTLNWPGAPGKSYKVQFKSNLTDGQWIDLGGNPSVLGNQASFSTTAAQAGYFRVLGVN